MKGEKREMAVEQNNLLIQMLRVKEKMRRKMERGDKQRGLLKKDSSGKWRWKTCAVNLNRKKKQNNQDL